MEKKEEDLTTYVIPPNFVDKGSFFGGMFKFRNVIEAGIAASVIVFPVMNLQISLTAKIIILCLTALPVALLALIEVAGESLSSFILSFFQYLKNRRMIKIIPDTETLGEQNRHSRKKKEFLISDYLPISKIQNGIICTKDKRYIKILELTPINFLLRNTREQKNIIYSFISYLKVSPVKIQIKVITKKADLNKHLETVRKEAESETNESCRELVNDYTDMLQRIGSREAVTRRFFLIFEHETIGRSDSEEDAMTDLITAASSAKTYLFQCGNTVIEPDDEDEAVIEILYDLFHGKSLQSPNFRTHTQEIISKYMINGIDEQIPFHEFFSPMNIDFSNSKYVKIEDTYFSYLLIPSRGYKPRVFAGWLSLLVNAGEGIDLDIFLYKQPKDRIIFRLGQQIRINRSKIKDASDTNVDFDDLSHSIQSGYFLKEGLSNNEDFYYLSILITVTANSEPELTWRINEMKKLLISQDLEAVTCNYKQEQAFLSTLPLVTLEKHLFERSKRNVLTLGAASCYPFLSYEICDDNGILLGINKHNNSLVITDIFNSQIYKNANMAILGTSGAGKTFTLQLMALRMRRRQIQVFIVAPLKGHEFYRASNNIGGEFIQISPSSANCINIMEIRPTDSSASELIDGPAISKSMLAAKIQRLHIFFSLLIPDMNNEERQLLDDALIRTYNQKGITHDNDSLIRTKEMPILENLYDLLVKDPATKRMANILNRLVHGSAATFNKQTNVNLDNKYTVLDISELTGDLLTVGMFVAIDYVWDKAKQDRTQEKAIYIDEAWKLMGASSNKMAADFVLEIFKIIRGYGGAAICATQDLNDFFALDDGKYGRGIINTSKTKIILNLEDDEAQRVQEVLHLSEAETMAITHFERGNGLISTNNNNVTVEFRASDLEKELITTDRNELKQIIKKRRGEIENQT